MLIGIFCRILRHLGPDITTTIVTSCENLGCVAKMPTTLVFKFLAAVIFNFVISVHTLEVDLTVDVKPGHEECFYEEIKKPTSFEIEYQVGKGQILALDDYLYL